MPRTKRLGLYGLSAYGIRARKKGGASSVQKRQPVMGAPGWNSFDLDTVLVFALTLRFDAVGGGEADSLPIMAKAVSVRHVPANSIRSRRGR